MVALRNSGHLGRIGDWAEMAARAGKVSLHFVNTSGGGILVAPFGGTQRRLSANPIAAGVPVKSGPPIVLDISTCTIAEGKIKVAFNKGAKVADGCILDGEGHPTNDPQAFYASPPGAILPLGGHKGYSLSVIAEVLAGALTGGSCSHFGVDRVANNMLSIFIDPGFFQSADAFSAEIEGFITHVKSSKTVTPDGEILMPGEPEARNRVRRLREGIEIDDTTWGQIVATAESLGVAVDAAAPSMRLYGLKIVDGVMIAGYFAVVMAIGFWSSRKVKTEADFFLGGRRFGKGLLIMHWLCTGTHSEMAVQVAGATARVGLGGIWYQWMWLFSTPFYWLMAPVTRRLRVTTTGDYFRIRYGRGLEMLYALVGLLYFGLSIALLLRGAGAAISGATGGAVPTEASVIVLAVLFSTLCDGRRTGRGRLHRLPPGPDDHRAVVSAGARRTEPGWRAVWPARQAGAGDVRDHGPSGAREGDPWFVVTMSVLGLVGFVVQPHVMTATGSGKTETEARVGMVYGNFIKRLLTIAWAFTGLIALAAFPEVLAGLDVAGPEARHASETLFGRAIQHFLGDGWRGLMIACLIAGVTSAETFMVGGSALFTRNFYVHAVAGRSDTHYLWVGRLASGGLLLLGILLAVRAESVTQLVVGFGQADRLARCRVLAGRGLAASQRGGRLGQLSGEPC